MRLRPPGPDDVDGVLAVITARDVADLGAPDFTREDLVDEWGLSDFSLAHDAAVVEDDQGRIVGYAAIRRMGALVAVAPEDEGRGIGTELLRFAERRQRELGATRHRQWIAAANDSGQALLHTAGYEPVRSYWRLERPLAQLDPVPEVPAGLVLRNLDTERDGVDVHAIDDAAFAPHPDYEPQSLAAFREEHLGAHDLDPELSWIAERESDRRVVGFLLARRRDDSVAYIHILAVAPDHQGGGLGTLMLRRATAGFAAAGLTSAQLGVASDNPRALHLYERAGMTVSFRVDTVERAVRSAAQAHGPTGADTMAIRAANTSDWPRIWPFRREIVRAGETFSCGREIDEGRARALWMASAPGRTFVAVASAGSPSSLRPRGSQAAGGGRSYST